MSQDLALREDDGRAPDLDRLVGMVTNSLPSLKSRRDYGRALRDFVAWLTTDKGPDPERPQVRTLCKADVQVYAESLRLAGMGGASINQRLSAIRKLAREALDNDLISDAVANGIQHVRGVPQRGQRTGNWLTLQQAQALIHAPDVSTLAGLRDRALLSVLLGCGLRRSEAASLTVAHVQLRDARWVAVDLCGKRSKLRSVPMPTWCKQAIDAWTDAAGITEGRIFRAVNKGDRLAGESMTDQAVYYVIDHYGKLCGYTIAAHDLRRSYAKLARKGGSAIEQIQLTLGHESLETTQRYLGEELDLTDAPGDRIHIRL